jgi:hypothetical protein
VGEIQRCRTGKTCCVHKGEYSMATLTAAEPGWPLHESISISYIQQALSKGYFTHQRKGNLRPVMLD